MILLYCNHNQHTIMMIYYHIHLSYDDDDDDLFYTFIAAEHF